MVAGSTWGMRGENMNEPIIPKGTLYIYAGRVTIGQHLAGKAEPLAVIRNLIPDVGRDLVLEQLEDKIDEVVLGDDGSPRSRGDTDLHSEQFSAFPTDLRKVGQTLVTDLFVGTDEANFTHREFGIKGDGILLSALVIDPEFEKDETITRTYIHRFDFDG